MYKCRFKLKIQISVIEENNIYQGRHVSVTPVAVTESGGGACAFAAAAYMLLL